MKTPAIKICRVSCLKTAKLVSWLGADFIGLHAITAVTHDVISEFQTIQSHFDSFKGSTRPVLLTKTHDIAVIVAQLQITGINYIQLHDRFLTERIAMIRRMLRIKRLNHVRIIALVDPQSDDNTAMLSYADRNADYILFDHSTGGTGLPLPLRPTMAARYSMTSCKVFIAGGLSPANVAECIQVYKPDAVDVQTGVEIAMTKRKSPRAIADFICTARSHPLFQGGVGLDIPVSEAVRKITISDISEATNDWDVFNITWSEASPSASVLLAEKLFVEYPETPYDVEKNSSLGAREACAALLKANQLLRCIYIPIVSGGVLRAADWHSLKGSLLSRGVTLGMIVEATEPLSTYADTVVQFMPKELHIRGASLPAELRIRYWADSKLWGSQIAVGAEASNSEEMRSALRCGATRVTMHQG